MNRHGIALLHWSAQNMYSRSLTYLMLLGRVQPILALYFAGGLNWITVTYFEWCAWREGLCGAGDRTGICPSALWGAGESTGIWLTDDCSGCDGYDANCSSATSSHLSSILDDVCEGFSLHKQTKGLKFKRIAVNFGEDSPVINGGITSLSADKLTGCLSV